MSRMLSRLPLIVLLSIAGLLIAGVTIAVLVGAGRFIDSSHRVAHTHSVLESLERAYAGLRGSESAQRGYLLTADAEYELDFVHSLPRATTEALRLVRLVDENPPQRERAVRFHAMLQERTAVLLQRVGDYRRGGIEAVQPALRADVAIDTAGTITALRDEIADVELAELAARRATFEHDAFWVRAVAVVGQMLGALILAMVGWRLLREVGSRTRAEALTAQANADLQQQFGELQKIGRQTRELTHYSGLLQSCRNQDEAMAVTADAMRRLLPELGGAVYLTRASQNLVERRAMWGDPVVACEALVGPDGCWALRRGHIFEATNVADAIICAHAVEPLPTASAWTTCIPLFAHGESMGFVYLSGLAAQSLSRSSRDIATGAAEQLALALSNLQLQETLRTQSVRDPLTGLFNRRYLEETFERELARCSRRGMSLSLLMIDIDHFKKFNDSFGHDGGDALLVQVGACLRSLCRSEDAACRFGGEEFTIVMPEADIAIAMARAEQIRQAVVGLRVMHQRQSLGEITVSIGVATFPVHGDTMVELMRFADGALYRAKRGGRNRVMPAKLPDSTPGDTYTL